VEQARPQGGSIYVEERGNEELGNSLNLQDHTKKPTSTHGRSSS
jgi:hypothetical protein